MPSHHKRDSAPGGSQRQLRVGEIVRHAVADLLAQGAVHDPDLEGHIITVPEVRMSPDLKLATVYVMPLGGKDTEKVIAALARNKKFLRGEIARRINLKFSPDIRFRFDERFDGCDHRGWRDHRDERAPQRVHPRASRRMRSRFSTEMVENCRIRSRSKGSTVIAVNRGPHASQAIRA